MADTLRRLVNIGTFTVLQEKLEKWFDDYRINTTDQNVARGCEIIELNAKVQGQLFRLLQNVAAEGGTYGGASTIKNRLLPLLSQGFLATGISNGSISGLIKEKEINDIQDMYESSLRELETDLKITQEEAQDLKSELEDTKSELLRAQRSSTSEKMFTDAELRDTKNQIEEKDNEIRKLRARSNQVDDYERQIKHLKDEIHLLLGLKPYHTCTYSCCLLYPYTHRHHYHGYREPELDSIKNYRYLPRTGSPLSIDDITQQVRQRSLIQRYNDLYSIDRIDAMETLRRYSDDHQNNQRICFLALTEAFSVAKLAFRQYKMRVRSNLSITHSGPETLEEAVQDYINRHSDSYDLPDMVSSVTRALTRNSRIYLPIDVTYSCIRTFISEACKLAWGMNALAHPLDIAVCTDAELFDDHRYRRSYDSEFTAPLVHNHVWPCLLQGTRVIVKGEAVTKRGASLNLDPLQYLDDPYDLGTSRSRSTSRSLSPTRALSPTRGLSTRSRSPSPMRRGVSPINLPTTGKSSLKGNTLGSSGVGGSMPDLRKCELCEAEMLSSALSPMDEEAFKKLYPRTWLIYDSTPDGRKRLSNVLDYISGRSTITNRSSRY